MTDRLDRAIRELYSELTDAAPGVPPLARAAVRRRVLARPAVRIAAAAAVVLLFAGVGAGLLTQMDLAGEDDGASPPATEAPADPGDSADTIVGAPETPEATGAPRPVDRILLLSDLNRGCRSARETISAEIGSRPESEDDYRAVFGLLFDELESLRLVLEAANPGLADPELSALGDEIVKAQGAVISGGEGPMAPRYAEATGAMADLGAELSRFGALDCAQLGGSLP